MKHTLTAAATLAMLTFGGMGQALAFYDFQCVTVDYNDCANPNFTRPMGCFSSRFESRCEYLVTQRASQELQSQANAGALSVDELATPRTTSALPLVEDMFEHAQGRFTDIVVPPVEDMMTFQERLMTLFPVIANCEEYVFQLSHDFSLYKIAARYFGDNYAGLYRYAYDWGRLNEGAVGIRAQYSSLASNRTLGGWNFSYMQPKVRDQEFLYRAKNDYFEMAGDAFTEFQRRQPALASILVQGRSHYYVSNIWSFHRSMGSALRNESPAKLAFLKKKRQDFLRMLEERVQLDKRIRDARNSWTRMLLRRDKTALDDGIEQALLEADSAGCLTLPSSTSSSSAHACDWAHQDFHDEITGLMQTAMDHQHTRCIEVTGDDFGDLPPNYRVNNSGPYVVSTNPANNEHNFEAFLRGQGAVDTWISREVATNSVMDLPRWGYDSSDSWDKGNSLFGASWSHRAYWHIDGVSNSSDSSCDVNMRGFARLQADARVFGLKRRLLYARAQFNARKKYAEYRFQVRGMSTLYGSTGSSGSAMTQQAFNVVLQPDPLRHEKKLLEYSDTFTIVGFPIAVEAGVTGVLGLDAKVTASSPKNFSGCSQGIDLNASAIARPYAGLHAFADAGVGITGLRAGAGAEMTVFEAGLPVSLEMNAHAPQGRLSEMKVDVDLSAKFDYTALQGSLYAFIEYPTGVDVSWDDGVSVSHQKSKKTLVDFSGFTGSIPVLESHFDFDLPLIRSICALSAHDCGS